MFHKGDYVVNANNGVCLVEDINTPDINGIDKSRKYYILKPVFLSGSTIYTPVDAPAKILRKAMDQDQAQDFIRSIPNMPTLSIPNEKNVEMTYKEYLRRNTSEDLLKLIKTIYLRREKRISDGHKITAVDGRYFKLAEDYLYGELSVALSMPKEEVKNYIIQCISPA